jgi:hypothetical protein
MLPGISTIGRSCSDSPLPRRRVRWNALHRCLWLVGSLPSIWGCGGPDEPAGGCPVVGTSVLAASGPLTYSGLTSGEHGSCVVASDGSVYCWSYGDHGDPVAVSDVTNARRVVSGPGEACAIGDGGSVACWTDSGPTEAVAGICGATELAVAELATCAVVSGGQVACRGQVDFPGARSGYSQDVVRIPGVTRASALAFARRGSACALIEDGTISCWGPESPSTLPGISGAIALSGRESTQLCALLADQTVRCWRPGEAPVRVEGLSQVVSLSAGELHSCAVLTDGTVRCWGDNSSGQLGDGTRTNSDVPLPVEGLEGVREVSAGTRTPFGGGYTCALKAEGSAACWGAMTLITANGDWISSPTPVTTSLP